MMGDITKCELAPVYKPVLLCGGSTYILTFFVIILSLLERSPHYAFTAPTKCIINNKHLSVFPTISLPLISTARQNEQSYVYVNHCSVVQ